MAHGSSHQHLACSFRPACLRCRTLVDTKVLLYVLCCSVQGRLKAVLLCLRYVDTMAFGAWVVLLGVHKKKKKHVQKQKLRCLLFVFLGGHIASRAVALPPRRAPPPQSCSMTWTEKSGCVANLPHTNTHARACCCLLLLWCCCCTTVGSGAAITQLPLALSSLPHVTKKRKKKRTSQKPKKAKNFGKVLFPNNQFSRRQLRAEKG